MRRAKAASEWGAWALCWPCAGCWRHSGAWGRPSPCPPRAQTEGQTAVGNGAVKGRPGDFGGPEEMPSPAWRVRKYFRVFWWQVTETQHNRLGRKRGQEHRLGPSKTFFPHFSSLFLILYSSLSAAHGGGKGSFIRGRFRPSIAQRSNDRVSSPKRKKKNPREGL